MTDELKEMNLVDAIQEYDSFRQHTRQTDSLRLIDNPLLRRIGQKADALGLECYVVGGYVRDIILERPSKDIDVVVVSPLPAPPLGECHKAAEKESGSCADRKDH